MIQPDPEISLHAASLEQSLNRLARELAPEDFSGLIGAPGLSILRSAMDAVLADSLSIWLADHGENFQSIHSDTADLPFSEGAGQAWEKSSPQFLP